MSFFNAVLSFLQAHHNLAYFALFIVSYFDTLIGTGFLVHGEFVFLPGAILAGVGILNFWIVYLVCVLGGILGDTCSYFIGHKYGKKVVAYLFKHENKYLKPAIFEKAKEIFHKSGAKTVFLARFLGPISWITPFVAGTLDLGYKPFIKYNIPGVTFGIGQFMLAGYFLGFSYQLFLGDLQALILGVVTIVAAIIYYIYKNKPKQANG